MYLRIFNHVNRKFCAKLSLAHWEAQEMLLLDMGVLFLSMRAMLRNLLKYGGVALVIVLLGIVAIFGIQYIRYRTSPEYKAISDLKNLEKRYAEDPYGGETPEETLRLFIEALKSGDTDLAAKYFVLDKQDQWREDLAKIQEKNLLGDMIKDLEKLKKIKENTEEVFYTTTNEKNIVSVQLIIGKNPYSNRWKIYEL